MGGVGSGRKPIARPTATREMIARRVDAARRSVDKLNPTETGMVIVALWEENERLRKLGTEVKR